MQDKIIQFSVRNNTSLVQDLLDALENQEPILPEYWSRELWEDLKPAVSLPQTELREKNQRKLNKFNETQEK